MITGEQLLRNTDILVSFDEIEKQMCKKNVTVDSMVTLQHCPENLLGRFVILESISETLKSLQLCEIRVFGQGTSCGLPLGMTTGQIKAVQITASSWENLTTLPHFARLFKNSNWCPQTSDNQPYLQVSYKQSSYINPTFPIKYCLLQLNNTG